MIELKQLNRRFNNKIAAVDNGFAPELEYLVLQCFKNEKFSILDVGANLGSSAYYFLKTQTNASVHSFEPNPKLIPYLKKVQNLFPQRMNIYPFGLGEKNCDSKLYVPFSGDVYYSGLGSQDIGFAIESYNSLRGIKIFEELDGFDTLSIQIKKGDLLELPIDCRFVKIDVEGYEDKCIKGMISYIKRVKPIIMVEFFHNAETITNLLSDEFIRIDINDVLKNKSLPVNIHSRNALFVPVNQSWKQWIKTGGQHEL